MSLSVVPAERKPAPSGLARAKTRARSGLNSDAIHAAAIHLSLRILMKFKGRIGQNCYDLLEDEHRSDLGLPCQGDGKVPTFAEARRHIRARVKVTLPAYEHALTQLIVRAGSVQHSLSLDEHCLRFLLLALCNSNSSVLFTLSNACPVYNIRDGCAALENVLGGRGQDWEGFITGRNALLQCGLMEPNDRSFCGRDLNDFLGIKSQLPIKLYLEAPLHGLLLDDALAQPKPANTQLTDFAHLGSEIALVQAVLKNPKGPAHVLLAGPPGTGKTELAHRIGESLGYAVRTVRSDDDDGGAASRQERLGHYRVGCKLLGKAQDTLIIFDEVEDVFQSEHLFQLTSGRERQKGWMTSLLETTQIPTIWITNALDSIDPAYLRRFDHIVQLDTPPRSVRHRLLQQAIGSADVPAELLDRAAESTAITPADTARLARVLPRALAVGIAPAQAFTKLLTARPAGITKAQLTRSERGPRLPFKLEWLNTSQPVDPLLKNLQRRAAATLLFSGPPGTGKTELAKYVAKALDKPLHLKKASDLIDKYVGETEKNMARAFARAEAEGALLFIDEADSFLQSREGAQRSWEISQVNEMLAQLDSYSGLCILATNFIDSLDRAVLRRMDVKLSFSALKPDAIEAAYRSALVGLKAAAPRAMQVQAVRKLDGLCFGDLVAALRGLSLQSDDGAATLDGMDERLLSALRDEVRQKKGMSNGRIGFID